MKSVFNRTKVYKLYCREHLIRIHYMKYPRARLPFWILPKQNGYISRTRKCVCHSVKARVYSPRQNLKNKETHSRKSKTPGRVRSLVRSTYIPLFLRRAFTSSAFPAVNSASRFWTVTNFIRTIASSKALYDNTNIVTKSDHAITPITVSGLVWLVWLAWWLDW